jgi:alpha-tubulin suppressor-like RCC1 family protein
MAQKTNGSLWGTGANFEGKLGLGATASFLTFTQIGTDTDWNLFSLGQCGAHSLAVKIDGSLWATGRNGNGQLGLGDNVDRNVFTRVGGENTWIKIDAGTNTSLAVKSGEGSRCGTSPVWPMPA